jgi:hypothetical protein
VLPLLFLQSVNVQLGGFAARDRVSTGGTIAAELRTGGTRHQLRSWVGLGDAMQRTQRPIAPGGYQLMRGISQSGHLLSAATVADGPLTSLPSDWRAWYVVGAAASVRQQMFERTASRIVDVDGDGAPDRTGDQRKMSLIPCRYRCCCALADSGIIINYSYPRLVPDCVEPVFLPWPPRVQRC